MRTAAIICEYNPYHNGHAYQMAQIRKVLPGAAIIGIMSGNYVQRGDAAVSCKYERAKAAVLGGADLVLELPFPHCCASAEIFADAGVFIAQSTGVADTLAFGAETTELTKLKSIAENLRSDRFQSSLSGFCENSRHTPDGFPCQRERLYQELFGKEDLAALKLPNNILALEYLRALEKYGTIEPLLIPRKGAAHDAENTSDDFTSLASASQVRTWIAKNKWNCVRRAVPETSFAVLEHAFGYGSAPADMRRAESALLWYFRNADTAMTAQYADMPAGMAGRFRDAARNTVTLDGMIELCKSKKITNARIRRSLLYAFFQVPAQILAAPPAYTCVLAANERGKELLSRIKKQSSLPVLTKPAHYKRMSDAARYAFELSLRADAFWHMLLPKPLPAGAALRYTPYIHGQE